MSSNGVEWTDWLILDFSDIFLAIYSNTYVTHLH